MKILLADDSMTAQNLGKKILLDAGFEVIAVSNGAVAMKKIASEKPDLLILDVFMPGYTGLELCQKVKGAPETARTPVLLTVGKMEPFRAEEGAKVGADGVIVKPFEASDLIATIQKLTEKFAPKKDAVGERTMKLKPMEDFKDESYQQWKTDESAQPEPTAKLQVPQEMQDTAAYDEPAFDVQPPQAAAAAAATEPAAAGASPWFSAPVTSALEATSPQPPAWTPASSVVEAPPTPPYFGSESGSENAPSTFEVAAPGAEASAAAAPSQPEHFSAPAPPIEFSSFSSQPAPAEVHTSDAEPQLESTPQPDFSPSAATAPPGFETTAAPPVEVSVSAPAGFEPTIPQATADPVIVRDPALDTGPTNVSEFATSFGVAEPGAAAPAPELELEVSPSEAAAAPAHPTEVIAPVPELELGGSSGEADATSAAEISSAEPASATEPEFGAEVSASPFQATPEPEPPPAPEPSVGDKEFAAALQAAISDAPVAAPEPLQPVESHSFAAASDSSPVSSDSSPVAGFDPALVARAVDRVLDRFKAEVIAEIQRELRR